MDPWWKFHGNVSAAPGTPVVWSYTGFVPSLIQTLFAEMGIVVDFFPLRLDATTFKLIPEPQTGLYDVVVGPFAIIPRGVFIVPLPIYQFSKDILLRKARVAEDLWQVFAPFTLELWVVVVVCVTLAALGMLLIDVCMRGTRLTEVNCQQVFRAFYHAWGAMLGGDDFQWDSWPAKVLRLGLLLLILVVSATYTANLAAFLTEPAVKVFGPKDMYELKTATVCRVYGASRPDPFVGHIVDAPFFDGDFATAYDFCYKKLEEGSVDAITSDSISSHAFMLQHCSTLHKADGMKYSPHGIHFALRMSDVALATNLTTALYHFTLQPEFLSLEQAELRLGQTCKGDDDEEDSTEQIRWKSMFGVVSLFLAFLVIAALSGLMEALSHWRKRRAQEEDRAVAQVAQVPQVAQQVPRSKWQLAMASADAVASAEEEIRRKDYV